MGIGLTPEDILSHPRFGEARSRHVDEAVKLFKGDRFVTRMMADAGVIMLRGFLVGFHFAFDAGDPSTWATPGNLRRALVERGLASPRRFSDMIGRFLQVGLVTFSPSPADRRSKVFAPTEQLVAHDRDHLAAYHTFLLHLFPGRGYEWILSRDEAAHRAIRVSAIHDLPRAGSALTHPAMRLFLARDGGYLALLLVLQAHLLERDGPTWTAMSEALGASRSHLRSLFAEAEAAGYVCLDGRRPVNISPLLWSAYDDFLSGVEADQDAIAQVAFASLDSGINSRSRQK